MTHKASSKLHIGQKVKLRAWGYEFPMETPAMERTIEDVEPGYIFTTREDSHSDGSKLKRDCSNWRVEE